MSFLEKTYPISEHYVEDILKEIVRHIISHDIFDSIDLVQNMAAMRYDIECHCGKKWEITVSDMIYCNVEAQDVVDFVENFNTQNFHNHLSKIKEQGRIKTEENETLLKRIQSPTISFLEI